METIWRFDLASPPPPFPKSEWSLCVFKFHVLKKNKKGYFFHALKDLAWRFYSSVVWKHWEKQLNLWMCFYLLLVLVQFSKTSYWRTQWWWSTENFLRFARNTLTHSEDPETEPEIRIVWPEMELQVTGIPFQNHRLVYMTVSNIIWGSFINVVIQIWPHPRFVWKWLFYLHPTPCCLTSSPNVQENELSTNYWLK